MQVTFRGIFLTSDKPAATADFYRKVALLPFEAVGEEGQYVYWRLDREGMQLAIHDAKAFAPYAHPPLADSNLTHLYFKIDDRGAFLTHLAEFGIESLSVDDVAVTAVDPDGRKVMFGTA